MTDYALYMLDLEGRVSSWNAGAERIKGYTRDEILGHHFSRFYTEEEREAGVPSKGLQQAATEGRWETEGWRVRKDGSRFWAHVVIDAIRNDAGELIGFAKITRDITERKNAERELEEAREALFQSQKMEAVGQLTGGVAHDFNNLLTVIIGGLDTIARSKPTDTVRIRRALEMSRHAADRAASLTSRLLAFSRKQALEPTPSDLNALVRNMADLLHRTLGEQIELESVLSPRLWTVEIDQNQLESAILNLAVNARDAMPSGGKLTIETQNTFLDESYAATDAEVRPGQYVADLRKRHRIGDVKIHLGAGVRALLHDKGAGPRHRSRPQHGLWLRQAVRRPRDDLQRGGRGNHGQALLPAAPVERGDGD